MYSYKYNYVLNTFKLYFFYNILLDMNNHFVLLAFKNYILNKLPHIKVDKLQIALLVTWIWAWIGMQITKIFEWIFKLILSMPNSWIQINRQKITTTDNKNVHIVNAYTENGEITNKLVLFLKYFWENSSSESGMDSNGFSVVKLINLLQQGLIFCSYLIDDRSSNSSLGVNHIVWEKAGNKFYKYENADIDQKEEIPFGHVDFMQHDDESQELDELFASISAQ
jgi:hypothetical protein